MARTTTIRHRKHHFFCLLPLLLLSLLQCYAQSKPSEYDVKAVYLFNFGKFLRLSSESSSSVPDDFDICVLDNEPLSASLDRIAANEQINGRPVRTLRIHAASEARKCAIAFLEANDASHLDKDITALAGSDVLTVSDFGGFLDHGGMIQFLLLKNRVRFAVNLSAVQNTHLILSSELLKVASTVLGKPRQGGQP